MCYFLPFYPTNYLKNQNFEKMKKMPEDIIILHLCKANVNHMLYGSWNVKHNRNNFFVNLGHFFTLYTNNQKIKILKNWKKCLEISSFYTSVPKIIIIFYTVPEKWHVMGVIFIFHFGLFFALPPPHPRNSPKN